MKYVSKIYGKENWDIVQFESHKEMKEELGESVIVSMVNDNLADKYYVKEACCLNVPEGAPRKVTSAIVKKTFADAEALLKIEKEKQAKLLAEEIVTMRGCKVSVANIAKIKNIEVDAVKEIIKNVENDNVENNAADNSEK